MGELQIKNVDLASNQLRSKGNTRKKILSEKGQDWVIQTTEYGSPVESSKSKKSWADKVEDEANPLGKKKSIWDDFDIVKLANVGYKLEYVTPTKKGKLVEIEMEDRRYEITYWVNVVACYELGAHPPFIVIQGYLQRLRGKYDIDKEALQGGIFHFDNKSFIVKE
ncbi:hypothetical protein KY284_010593 [Solanum tuberosum]|nr:hypothetical protein KY284_010593 [Solanum tuberosum]